MEPISNPPSSCPAPRSWQDDALPPVTSPYSREWTSAVLQKTCPEQLPGVPHHQMYPWTRCAPKPDVPHHQMCPTTRFPPPHQMCPSGGAVARPPPRSPHSTSSPLPAVKADVRNQSA